MVLGIRYFVQPINVRVFVDIPTLFGSLCFVQDSDVLNVLRNFDTGKVFLNFYKKFFFFKSKHYFVAAINSILLFSDIWSGYCLLNILQISILNFIYKYQDAQVKMCLVNKTHRWFVLLSKEIILKFFYTYICLWKYEYYTY